MLTLLIVGGLINHWLADFVTQSHRQSMEKSTNFWVLMEHAALYTVMWTPFIIITMVVAHSAIPFLFLPITFACHLATDYYTSRVHKVLWDEKKVHEFFVSIGFDQLLHYLQIYFTLKMLLQ